MEILKISNFKNASTSIMVFKCDCKFEESTYMVLRTYYYPEEFSRRISASSYARVASR